MPDAPVRSATGLLLEYARALVRRGVVPAPLLVPLWRLWRAGAGWTELHRQRGRALRFRYAPTLALLVPVRNGAPVALRRTVASVLRQSYPRWKLYLVQAGPDAPAAAEAVRALACADARVAAWNGTGGSQPNAALNGVMAAAQAELVALLDEGDELVPDALFRVTEFLNENPGTDVVYTDEEPAGGAPGGPMYKPDWSPEHFLFQAYTGRLAFYRRGTVQEVGGGVRADFQAAREYDLLLRMVERTSRVGHVREVLYRRRAPAEVPPVAEACQAVSDHLRRLGAEAECRPDPGGNGYRVRFRVRGTPRVSIVIPTAGMTRTVGERRVDLLANCVRSIAERTEYANYEIVWVDSGDLRPETSAALAAVEGAALRGITYTGPFNVAAKMNLGAAAATGEHLLFLNDDVEVVSGEWISAMLEFSQQGEVGAVGAKLYFPDGAIQHAGVVIPPEGSPGHVYYGFPCERQAEVADLQVVRNYSAVTGACLMTRAAVFREAGSFDPAFPVNYNDVDYCLKVRERGYRVVFTPTPNCCTSSRSRVPPRTTTGSARRSSSASPRAGAR
jgi:glycosyltransferase involved in cell wall biosynthesis